MSNLRHKKEAFADPEEEIIYNFLEVQTEALAKLKSAPLERTFNWRQVLAQAKSTRRLMNIELKKLNKLRREYGVVDCGGAVSDASWMLAGDRTTADIRESKFSLFALALFFSLFLYLFILSIYLFAISQNLHGWTFHVR